MSDPVQLEWDEAKRRLNIAKHGLDFAEAAWVFRLPFLRLPAREINGEVRHGAVGYAGEFLVTIIYTERGDTLRIISMRKARTDERRRFHREIHAR